MRRRCEEDADTLRVLFLAAREFAQQGPRLPARAALLLYYLGSQPEGEASFADVQRECGFGQSQASRLAAALAEAGLIITATPQADRRRSTLRLTGKGRSVLGRVIEAAQRHR